MRRCRPCCSFESDCKTFCDHAASGVCQLSDSSEKRTPHLLRNHWDKESAVNSVERPLCHCLDAPFDRRNWKELSIHTEKQDTNCAGWKKLLGLIDEAAQDGRDVFSPSREMHPAEWAQIVTLPASISKLKAVKHLILYGSSLVRIPPEIGEMSSLEQFTPYTSYRLHWFPYEIRKCKNLKDSTVSTRALYGNYKNRPPFPRLPQHSPEFTPRKCSICQGSFKNSHPCQAWISLPVGTDVLPLLVHACSEDCLSHLPPVPEGYFAGPHHGGVRLKQPLGRITAGNIRSLLDNGGYQDQAGPLPRDSALQAALKDAAENDHLQLVQELLAERAELISCADPLIAACENAHLRIVEYLIAQGADINGRGSFSGETPLMAAAGAGFVDGVRLLLRLGADHTLVDADGEQDALGWAEMQGAEHNFFDGMPDDARTAYANVVQMIKSYVGPAT